jgi:electron transfer flavoprotein alpha subunit
MTQKYYSTLTEKDRTMSILVYIELVSGELKKTTQEAVSYAAQMGKEVIGLALGEADNAVLASLGKNGLTKVYHSAGDFGDSHAIAKAIVSVMQEQSSKVLVMPKSTRMDSIGGRVAVLLNASMATNVIALPDTANGFSVKRSIFTGNAFATVKLANEYKILVLNKNIMEVSETGSEATVESVNVSPENSGKITKLGEEKAEGDILLTDADIVVSGGRGLKGPENWGMIEDLAKELGAATGCSKPVSDMDWRPHHEHVGQTGIKVSPNLYIAVGISGAIQHLAGVNSSKNIVVINKDEEAPFFKAADYGIVGDAFEVVPALTKALAAAK